MTATAERGIVMMQGRTDNAKDTMDAIETFEHAGLTVEIHYDEGGDHSNPREFAGNVGTMLCGHDRYNLGDEQVDDDFDTSKTCPRCEGTGGNNRHELSLGYYSPAMVSFADYQDAMRWRDASDKRWIIQEGTCLHCEGNGYLPRSLGDYLREERGAVGPILPLYLYDHSGITMRVGRRGDYPFDSAGWDTSDVGVIFATEDKLREHWTSEELDKLSDAERDERIERELRAEVEVYDLYISGQVYGYVITKLAEDEDAPDIRVTGTSFAREIDDVYPGFDYGHGMTGDSCWGFLGMDDVTGQAKEAAQNLREAIDEYVAREQRDRAWAAAMDVPTIG